MTERIGAHELNRQLEVWVNERVPDGQGGSTLTYVRNGMVWAKVSQPSAQERLVAAQAGATLTHVVHLLPNADVRRGDQLRGQGDTFEVHSVIQPSTPVYLRADVERVQPERDGLVLESS